MGMETQQQWSNLAIARTTPAILALYLIVTLAAKYLLDQHPMAIRQAAWYDKDRATVSDTIAMVRRSIWGAQIYNGREIDTIW